MPWKYALIHGESFDNSFPPIKPHFRVCDSAKQSINDSSEDRDHVGWFLVLHAFDKTFHLLTWPSLSVNRSTSFHWCMGSRSKGDNT